VWKDCLQNDLYAGRVARQPIGLYMLLWLSGNTLVSINIVSFSYCTSGPVTTWVGDRLWAGKPSQYVASHLVQLSLLPSVGQ